MIPTIIVATIVRPKNYKDDKLLMKGKRKMLQQYKILVIGSEGNVGRVLVPYLQECGHTIICTDVKPQIRENYYQADINIPIELMKIFMSEKPEIVYLLAAQVSRVLCEQAGGIAINTNITGVYNIIELCKMFGSKLIFMSSSEVYGNQDCILDEDTTIPQPNNRYGLTKFIDEQIVRYEVSQGLKAIILRPFMLYHESETRGEHRSAIIRFVDSLINGRSITIHKNSGRCWMYLEDAIKAMERAIHVENFETINLGSDVLVGTDYLASMIGVKLRINYIDYAIFEDLPDRMTRVKVPNIKKMIDILGIKSEISLDEGLDRVIDSFKR